jgi:hypothetical protein
MKKYTRRQRPRRYGKQKTRSKKYSRRRLRQGGASRGPSASKQSSRRSAPPPPTSRATPSRATPSAPPSARQSSRRGAPPLPTSGAHPSASRAPSGVVVIRNGVSIGSMGTAGISKIDAQVSKAVRLIANFPYVMDKFLEMVIYNHNLLSDNDVKIALQNKISINMFPATGRLSTNGIIFISYICGKLNHLLLELSRTNKSNVAKKIELLRKIKQIESVIYLLDDVGCSWGVRPYNAGEMKTIDDYYRIVNRDEAGLQEYYSHLNALIDTYFPDFKVHRDPSHVVSSSMARLLISQRVINTLPDIP